ncbi:PAS domain S-box [Opitutaceae bacterium TAV1]|nr:diguanylate cyclase [Opitutaceae bacterium TAV5]EIP97011.1 PAS domain S-box [Opitutaceae bacterium TAV1]
MIMVETSNLGAWLANQRGQLLLTILDEVRDFIFVKDTKGNFLYNNRAHLENLGRTQEETLGKNDFDLFPKEMAEGFFFDETRLFETHSPVIKVQETVNARGELFFVTALKLVVGNPRGDILGLVGIVRRLLSNDHGGLEKTHRDILEVLRREPGTTPAQLRAFELSLPMLLSRCRREN